MSYDNVIQDAKDRMEKALGHTKDMLKNIRTSRASSALIEHVRQHLAAYKAPRHVRAIDTIGRAPNGKVDYKGLKNRALEAMN